MIQKTDYGLTIQTTLSFDDAVEKTKALLQNASFGILTTIDVSATFKKKLDVEYPNYVILGVCHPQSAYKALETDKEIGLLLPCNVIVYEKNNQTVISAIRPTVALGIAKKEGLQQTAHEIEKKLTAVLEEFEHI